MSEPTFKQLSEALANLGIILDILNEGEHIPHGYKVELKCNEDGEAQLNLSRRFGGVKVELLAPDFADNRPIRYYALDASGGGMNYSPKSCGDGMGNPDRYGVIIAHLREAMEGFKYKQDPLRLQVIANYLSHRRARVLFDKHTQIKSWLKDMDKLPEYRKRAVDNITSIKECAHPTILTVHTEAGEANLTTMICGNYPNKYASARDTLTRQGNVMDMLDEEGCTV